MQGEVNLIPEVFQDGGPYYIDTNYIVTKQLIYTSTWLNDFYMMAILDCDELRDRHRISAN